MKYNFNLSGEKLFFLIVFNLGIGSSMQYIPNSFLLFIAACLGNLAIINVKFKKKIWDSDVGMDQINVEIKSEKDESNLS